MGQGPWFGVYRHTVLPPCPHDLCGRSPQWLQGQQYVVDRDLLLCGRREAVQAEWFLAVPGSRDIFHGVAVLRAAELEVQARRRLLEVRRGQGRRLLLRQAHVSQCFSAWQDALNSSA